MTVVGLLLNCIGASGSLPAPGGKSKEIPFTTSARQVLEELLLHDGLCH